MGLFHASVEAFHSKGREETFSIRGELALIPERGDLARSGLLSCKRAEFPSLETNMPDEEWITTLGDGRKVKFIYQELPQDGAFISAQLAGNEVVYSIVLTKARNPLSREDVESRFKDELSKK